MSIEPAMTPEEWAGVRAEMGISYEIHLHQYGKAGWDGDPPPDVDLSASQLQVSSDSERHSSEHGIGYWQTIPDELMHQAAALCLHEKEYGFTREMVHKLRNLQASGMQQSDVFPYGPEGQTPCEVAFEFLEEMADIIGALLPPEPK